MARLVPLGGLGEIGLNAMVFELGGERLLVDAGLMFPGPDLPGVDILVPDFTYALSSGPPLTGLVLTHAHEDHIGAVSHLLRQRAVPVYGTRLTLGMLAQRLDEAGVVAELRELCPGERVRVGNHFDVEPFRVAHSLPDAVGLALHTPQGALVHTGDFKLDDVPLDGRPTDVQRLGELGDAGVLCLLSDSTNAEVQGETPPERLVAETFARLLPAAPGRVLVAMFASQLHRVQHLLDLCERTGRRVVVAGRAMARNVELAQRLGYLRVPDGLLAEPTLGASLPPARVCILTTGAQGEPLAALSQMLQPEAEPCGYARATRCSSRHAPFPATKGRCMPCWTRSSRPAPTWCTLASSRASTCPDTRRAPNSAACWTWCAPAPSSPFTGRFASWRRTWNWPGRRGCRPTSAYSCATGMCWTSPPEKDAWSEPPRWGGLRRAAAAEATSRPSRWPTAAGWPRAGWWRRRWCWPPTDVPSPGRPDCPGGASPGRRNWCWKLPWETSRRFWRR